MQGAEQYRLRAKEAEHQAEMTSDPDIKRQFLDIARQWQDLANQAERRGG